MQLSHERLRQALLALDVVVESANDRLEAGRGLHERMIFYVHGKAIGVRDLSHDARLFRRRHGGVKGHCGV